MSSSPPTPRRRRLKRPRPPSTPPSLAQRVSEWKGTATIPAWNSIFNSRTIPALCTTVYDGDTLTAVVDIPVGTPVVGTPVTLPLLGPYTIHVRLSGYDAPERKTPDATERRHGEQCRRTLEFLVLGKCVLLECEGLEKFGRLLARVHVVTRDAAATRMETLDVGDGDSVGSQNVVCVNDYMVRETPCVGYDGGRRTKDFDYGRCGDLYTSFAAAATEATSRDVYGES